MNKDKLSIRFFGGDEEYGNVFVVETFAPAGYELGSHVHKHAHTSVLVQGVAEVIIDGVKNKYTGYNIVTVPAGSQHCVKALTDIIWLCLWDGELAPKEEAEESLKLQRYAF